MKKRLGFVLFQLLLFGSAFAEEAEKTDSFLGDWKDNTGSHFAQVYQANDRTYFANLTTDITSRAAPLAVLQGVDASSMSGDGWNGRLEDGKLVISNGAESLELRPHRRTSPTINAPPPKGAVVLFDGSNLDAWTKVIEKDWLEGGAPVDNWKIVPDSVLEVVPRTSGFTWTSVASMCLASAAIASIRTP